MRLLDKALGWFLVFMGCVHNFVAAPLTFDGLSTRLLWFLSAGLALWFAGFINLLRAQTGEPSRLLGVFCLLTNVSLLAFVLLYAAIEGNWLAPEAVLLLASVAGLTARSVAAFVRRFR